MGISQNEISDMTTDERHAALVERVAKAMWETQYPTLEWTLDANSSYKIELRVMATAALSLAMEEAAQVAKLSVFPPEDGLNSVEVAIVRGGKKAAENIEATIRALIPEK